MTEPRRFTEVERHLLDALLAGDHPVLHALRRQARVATTSDRFFSGGGVDVEIHVPRAEPAVRPTAFTLSDVAFELESTENWGQALLFVRDGFLARLTLSNWTAHTGRRRRANARRDPRHGGSCAGVGCLTCA